MFTHAKSGARLFQTIHWAFFKLLVAGVMDSTLTLATEESEYEPFRPQSYLVPVVFEKEPEDSDHTKGISEGKLKDKKLNTVFDC